MSADTMREQLEAAYESTDAEEGGGSEEDPQEPLRAEGEEGTEADGGGAAEEKDRDEKSVPTEGKGEPEDPGKPKESASKSGEPVSDDKPAAGDEGTPDADKAPVSWKPAVREHWAKLPAEVKVEVARREREIQNGLQQASGHRKVAEEYYRVVQPFQSMIQAQGSSPAQAIHQLMSTAAQLTNGSVQRKAEVVRNIIKEYGVDIGTLDKILSGETLPDDPNASLLTAMDEKLQPITDFMGRVTEQQQGNAQQMNTEADEAIDEFAEKHDFYEDLRDDMADLLEMAANRGRNMTMEEAYERAGAAHPDISKIMTQRKAAEENKLDAKGVQKKRDAASSVRGSPAGAKTQSSEGSMRAVMEEAWDDTAQDRV